jgi:hypothetical protein
VFKFTHTKPLEVASAISAADGGGAAGAFIFGALVAVAVAVACADTEAAPKESSAAVASAAVINFIDKRFMHPSLQRRNAPGEVSTGLPPYPPLLCPIAGCLVLADTRSNDIRKKAPGRTPALYFGGRFSKLVCFPFLKRTRS